MLIRVLGASAGGGFPQWNCNCANCAGMRAQTISAKKRTQSSIALGLNNKQWLLLNASPDILQQLENYADMQPNDLKRQNCFAAIMLIDSQIDHTTGLLSLREAGNLVIYSTESVYQDLTNEFPLINVLSHYCEIEHHVIQVGDQNSFAIKNNPQLQFTAIHLQGKAPPYSPHRQSPTPGDNIALFIKDTTTNQSLFFAPGLEVINEEIIHYMQQANCLLVDGTFWHEDEMIQQGVGHKCAKDMGHLPLFGENGMIKALNQFTTARKILIHINNTNPILREGSAERKILEQQQIEVAYDGMEIIL